MSVIQNYEMKIQNEVKIKIDNIMTSENTFQKIKEVVKFIFGQKVDFNLSKDWNITFAFKDGGDKTGTVFTGALKMTDKDVCKDQLSLFSNDNFQEDMQEIVDNDPMIDEMTIINPDTGEEKIIAKKKERKVKA